MPDNPVVTVEIRGAFRAGKSSVATLLYAALGDYGIPTSRPDDLPPLDLNRALPNLKRRGLSVQIVETETGDRVPIDARFKGGGAEFLRRANLGSHQLAPLTPDDIRVLRALGFDPVIREARR